MIVTKSLREDMKHLLHVGHLGIVKIKERSRDILYWPGINVDLQNQQKDESLIAHDSPWTKAGTDLF